MPQFDPSTFASQLFWLYVSFTLLLILLSVFALPKIGGVLEERQKRIDGNLDKAAQWKAEAEAAIAAYEKALADSRAEAHKILQANAQAIAEQAEARQKALGEKLAAQIKAGESRIQAAKEQALDQIKGVSADLVKASLQRLTGQSAEDAQIEAAVTSSLGGRG
jgi:F-type H+-transporting ATPase subunit b